MLLSVSTHAILRGYSESGGPPLTLTHASSPKLKEVLGVTQSAANVSIVSGSGSGGESTGNSGAVISPALSRVSLFLDSVFLAVVFAVFAETETVPPRKIL